MHRNSSTYKQVMKKWKYFYLSDSNKETIGIVLAEDVEGAYDISSEIKNLPLTEFKTIFGIEML